VHEHLENEGGQASFGAINPGLWRRGKGPPISGSHRWSDGPICLHGKNTGEKRISKLELHIASPRRLRRGVFAPATSNAA
jgi:hypothetical protein